MILATLDRFGYELRVISETRSEAKKALMKAYRQEYKGANHAMPDREEIESAEEDISYSEMELNEVDWT